MQDSSIYKKLSYVAVTLFWLLTMGILIQRHYNTFTFSAPGLHSALLPPESLEEQWMGMYLKSAKIGYLSRKMSSAGMGYKMDEIFRIKIMVMGTQKDVETLLNADLDKNLKLMSFTTKMKGDLEMQISGIVQGKDMSLTINSGGVKTTKAIHLSKEPSLESSAVTEMLRGWPGDKISVPVFDPTILGVEDLELRISGKEKIMSLGRLEEAYKVTAAMKGIEFTVWVTEKGEVLREESPMGFLLVRETKETALKIDKPSLDLISEVAVPFRMKLPGNSSYLKVKISGINFRGLELDGGRQSLKGDMLEINQEEIAAGTKSPRADMGDKAFEEYLSATVFIQSKDSRIVDLAKDIVKDEKDPIASARLIYEWVYRNIEKVPTITIPMATDVLRTRKGDCNEHTTLFTALARAAGIPARIAVGLTYKDGSFYYHAWPEFYAGRWIAADPTLGQFPADAAHIRLITGDLDKQIQILPVINKIRLEGLAYR